MPRFLTFGVLSLLLIQTACAQRTFDADDALDSTSGGALSAAQAAYNVTFYDLDLAIHPDEKSIDGALTMEALVVHPLTQVVLDLDDALTVRAMQVSGEAVDFEHADGRIWANAPVTMQPGQMLRVTVQYGGVPREAPNPPWIGGFTWAETPSGQPWIATTDQGEGADLWWPVKDHPSDEPDSMALHINVPEPLVVATNGRLRNVQEHDNDTRTYHWFVSTPINNYGVALNIAPYRLIETTYKSVAGEQMPFQFWVLPENYEDGMRQFDQFVEHMAFYEKYVGPYPFRADKYGIAHTPHLGMEHQSIIAYGSTFTDEPRGFDWLHHHELAHEWWGNLVTVPDWKDFWIHEGFGTYMQALYGEERFGEEGYLRELQNYRGNIRNEKAMAPRGSRSTREIYFSQRERGVTDNDIYYKGSWVLHTLRYLVGRNALVESLRRMAYPTPEMEKWTDGRQCRFATSDDYIRIAETASGMELDWFFEVYLRQPDLPSLVAERTVDGLQLTWETPGDLPFPMPVPVEVEGTVQRVEMPDGTAFIPLAAGAAYAVDPDGWVLKAE